MVLAFLLWTVTKSDSRKVIRNVPIRVINADPAWVATAGPEPAAVDVRVAGPVRELLRLTSGRAEVELRVDQVVDSVVQLTLRPSQVRLADGADSTRVEAIIGDNVTVRFEEIVERVLPVRVPHIGAVPPGMVLDGRIRPLTPVVRVSGARSRVFAEQLDSIPVLPINLSSLDAADTLSLALDTTGLGLLTVVPPTIDVVIPLRLAPADTTTVGDVASATRRR